MKKNGQIEALLLYQLKKLWPEGPSKADAFGCALAQNWVETPETTAHNDYSNLGKLFETAIIDQFYRTSSGDRFWYTRNLDKIDLDPLPKVTSRTLAQMMRDNAEYDLKIPDNVFRVGKVYHIPRQEVPAILTLVDAECTRE